METLFKHNKYYVHSGSDYLKDKSYNPFAYLMLKEFSRTKAHFSDDIFITPEEKNYVLKEVLGYSHVKANNIIESLAAHNEINIASDGNIVINEFDTDKKQYVTIDKATAQYFYDTFGKEGLAFKVYIYLGSKWNLQRNLGYYEDGFRFTKGGAGNMSLLKHLGYKSVSQTTREKLESIFEILQQDGLLTISGPQTYSYGDKKMWHIHYLRYWGPYKEITEHNTSIATKEIQTDTNNIERFAPYLPKFRNYYLEQNSPRYNFVNDLSSLGEDCVLVLYEGLEDISLIRLLKDYPDKERIPHGRIMFSTLSNQDDDVDDIWSIEPYE